MKKKIEKEEKNYSYEYAPVVKAVIVLVILIGLLIGAILYQPTKKDVIVDPNTLSPNEKMVETDIVCDGDNSKNVKSDADKVSVIYEVVDDYFLGFFAETDEDLNNNGIIDMDPVIEVYGYALKLKLTNVTNNIYVVITNDLDDSAKTFHDTDIGQDGFITWFESENNLMRTYSVKVYSNHEGCTSELYREFTVELPKFNPCVQYIECQKDFAKDIEMCQPFIFSNKKTNDEIREYKKQIKEAYEKYEKSEAKKNEEKANEDNVTYDNVVDKATNFVKKNYVSAAIVGGAILALIIIFIVKKGRK